ncbi:prepilin-type N-terminal cleavage/methylation domain-containing protein [Fusobacterium russii]|uniref:prepilin-type N-terminal cleavage/methylation domain-containing protein n=1 Tax=Fusobacterium russii TaxID=854 RepID=UPI00039B5542|nr:prepilin-type N-terminal cleavage/methylation domain-containing protein [Fusobacterium russii]
MNKKGFSFIEIIVSITLLLFLLIPTLKINTQQILNFKKMDIAVKELDLFDSIYSYLQSENIVFFHEDNLIFKDYEDLKRNPIFQDFEFKEYPKESFDLKIQIKVSDIDFYSSVNKANIIYVNFTNNKKQMKTKIIKFIN